jgi:predicted DNA-binding protein (MmcQ/YjbR family)
MAKTPKSAVGRKIRARALGYPETTEHFPWGEHAFKVKGKTFVFMRDDGEGCSFSVKLAALRKQALDLPGSEPTHYGMGAKGWVTLRPTSKTSLELLYSLIDESFRAVAPKRVLQAYDAKLSK